MPKRQSGFTLIETMVTVIIGAILMASLFKLWSANENGALRIGNKGDFRNRATLASTTLNHAITMAGFGMARLDVVVKASTEATDTLSLYANPGQRRTTLRDTARAHATSILVFNDTGFTVGGMLGITDSLKQEFASISSITGDSSSGYRINLAAPLQNSYNPGVPDIYPAQKERFFIDAQSHALLHRMGSTDKTLADNITDFRVELKDATGQPATSFQTIRVVSFSFTGSYKAPQGAFNQMRFSSTVLPRNIL
jgi:prepilin-type N-terminal cleavage/methylation domain-containing protein